MTIKRARINQIAISFFALFLSAQLFKTMPLFSIINIDLTVLSLIVCLLFVTVQLFYTKLFFPSSFFLVLLIFLMSATFGFSDNDLSSEYASQKYLRFHILTLFAAFAPLIVIKSNNDLKLFLQILIITWSMYCLISFIGLYFSDTGINRASTFEENEIFLGRTSGSLLLITTILFMEKKLKKIYFFIALFALLMLLIASGTKAAIIASLSLIVIYMLLFIKIHKLVFFSAILTFFIILALPYIVSHIPSESISRILMFLNGDIGDGSGKIRLEMWGDSLKYALDHIWGIGLGGFSAINSKYSFFEYPHNIIIEYLLEVGIIPSIIFIIAIIISLKLLYKTSQRDNLLITKLSFILLLFFFLQALISGDLDGNRVFFSFFSIGLLTPAFNKKQKFC